MNFNTIRIPKKISPCPITEAIVELRFDSNQPAEVIPGIVFNKLEQKFPKLEKLPIMELPSFIRDNDPNLKFSPQYRLISEDFNFQFGPKCFSIVCPQEYKGWTKYFEQIIWIFNAMKELNIISKPLRIGLRYISFFKDIDIFDKIKINLSLAENSLIGCQNVFRTEFDFHAFRCVIQFANTALLNGSIKGSSFDVDIVSENITNIMDNFKDVIDSAHEVEKQIFFAVLKDDFLKKFNPDY